MFRTPTIVLALSACSASMGSGPQRMLAYRHEESTKAQFVQDRYECYKESLSRRFEQNSATYRDLAAGSSSSEVQPSCEIVRLCMASKGYEQVWVDVAEPNQHRILAARGIFVLSDDLRIKCDR